MMTHAELMDLRRRVLANEPVTDEELRTALDAAANLKFNSSNNTATTASVNIPKIDLGNAFAAFKAKQAGSATSQEAVTDAPPPSPPGEPGHQ